MEREGNGGRESEGGGFIEWPALIPREGERHGEREWGDRRGGRRRGIGAEKGERRVGDRVGG